jgi:amidase
MPIRRPSSDELRDIAQRAGIQFSDAAFEDYVALVDGVLDQYETVQSLPEPRGPSPSDARGVPTDVHRPDDDADPHNAWITKCRLPGADDGPLAGWSVGVKDCVQVAGVEMTCGSHLLEGHVPANDATVVTRILDAGGTVVGKNNMESFSFSSLGSITDFGTVENPNAPGYTTGGSSSGTAAAVAAGDVDLGIGTDQGGSIRMPAAMTGVVGLKPTHGLVPFTGVVPIEATVDHVGPLTQTVEAAATALDVLAGPDGLDDRQAAVQPTVDAADAATGDVDDLTVATLAEGFEQEPRSEAVTAVAEDAVADLATAGADVTEASVPEHEHGPELWTAIGAYGGVRALADGAATMHAGGYYDTTRMRTVDKSRTASARDFPPTVTSSWLAAAYVRDQYGTAIYGKAHNVVTELRAAYDAVLDDADIVAMPTVPVDTFPADDDDDFVDWIATSGLDPLGANTCPFNLTGHPAITVPCGTVDGRPVGLMLVGDHFDDATVLRAASAVEERTN